MVVRWCQIGKIVFFTATATITTNGNGSNVLVVSLPVSANAANLYLAIAGQETSGANRALISALGNDATHIYGRLYTGAYPAYDGAVLVFTGFYESA